MKIQVNSDTHIDSNEALAAHVRATVERALDRFREHVTRVEVHLSDENGSKSDIAGPGASADKRCVMEARPEGHQPLAVTCQAKSLDRAVHEAAEKLARLLDSTLGRLHEHRAKPAEWPLPEPEPGPG
ncbi:hypothetical protein BH11PSE8_BH11PSE8_31270 [soil metagenome]